LPAARPTITGVTPGAFGYGQTFLVQTPNAASIASVVLVRPGAQTHAIDMEQRLVGLNFTAGDGVLNVTAPPHGNIAPPGYYMLFVLDSAGVPSVASFVRIGGSISNQAPTAIINSPATNVTVNPGGAVSFSGTGTDPDGTISAYSWTFPGGTPSSASVATPGNVAYSTPGTYTASLSVTDNGGLVSSPATRTITVADFTLSATPSSRTVLPGASTTYTATATAGTGFTGTVAFSVTGLPAGATASFSPTSVTPSGTSTLTVATTTATPPGSYPLTIRGTSGPRVRTVNVTLVVNSGTFSITASPTSRTISRNAATTYTVTVPNGTGFVGTIALSVSGVPNHTTAKFSPTSIVNSGTSTLTVDTRRRVASGTYLLRISGTSGGIVRSVDVTLIVQ
jgi:PKD repeat protein